MAIPEKKPLGAFGQIADVPETDEEPVGALSKVAAARANTGSKIADFAKNIYGSDPSLGAQMGDIVAKLMPTAAEKKRSSEMAFWGGFGAPNTSGSLSGQLGNATRAQSERELEGEKLTASYVPMITQAMMANQTQTLAAQAQASKLSAELAPRVKAAVASLAVNGKPPTAAQVRSAIIQTGKTHNATEAQINEHLAGIPRNEKDVAAYVSRMGQEINPGGLGGDVRSDATGKLYRTTGAGNIEELKQGKAGSGGDINPSANAVRQQADIQSGTAEHAKALQEKVDAGIERHRTLQEINKNLANVTPGKYMTEAANLAASIKDIGEYIPGLDKSQLTGAIDTILKAPKGSKAALASIQYANNLLALQAMMAGHSALGKGMARNEFEAMQKTIVGGTADPESFPKMLAFNKKILDADAANVKHFSNYMGDKAITEKSVLDFNNKNNTRRIYDASGGANDTDKKEAPAKAEPVEAKSEPAKAKAEPAKAETIDLKNYPPGTKVSSSGKAFITNSDGSHSYVKSIK